MFERYTAALAYQDYRTLWIANLCSGAAAWALIVARGALVYNEIETNANLWVGIVTFAAMIPRVFIPPIAGYLSDKYDRRRVVSVMYAINFAQTLGLALYVLLGEINPWVIVGMSLINGSARAAQMPASQSLVPNLVPRNLLLNGIALNQATMQGSRLFGPLAIAPLLATVGVSGRFLHVHCVLCRELGAESQDRDKVHRHGPAGQQLHSQFRHQRLGRHQVRVQHADSQGCGVHGTLPLRTDDVV